MPVFELLRSGSFYPHRGRLDLFALRRFFQLHAPLSSLSPDELDQCSTLRHDLRASARLGFRARFDATRRVNDSHSRFVPTAGPAIGLGEWIFVAHHKSGTTVGKVLADELCLAFGRPIYKYTYRERPIEPEAPGAPLCHFLIKIYAEDLDLWLARVWRSPYNRLVHFVRDPVAMIASGYLFHRRGSELVWTNSTACSRDLCLLPEAWGADGSKRFAAAAFRSMPAALWLREYGCPKASASYYTCLNSLPAESGLKVEARRAYATIRTMVDVDALARGPRTFSVQLERLQYKTFNSTVAHLVNWLALANGSYVVGGRAKQAIIVRAYRSCFSSEQVSGIVSHGSVTSQELAGALSRWYRTATPAIRELAAHSWWASHKSPSRLFAPKWRVVRMVPHSRAILTCSAPLLLNATLLMLSRLQGTGCRLPIEVWHIDELNDEQIGVLTRHPALGRGLVVHNLKKALHPHLSDDDLQELRGFMCKPLALLASSVDEVMLVDHDARFFIDPALLFKTSTFMRTGALMFRDRLRLQIRGRPVKDASRFIRQLIRRRMGFFEMMLDDVVNASPTWPWQPAPSLLQAPIVTGETQHQIDSSVLLFSKRHLPRVSAALYLLHERFRHELYSNLHGDKETYWLACELVGGHECGVSAYAAGEMGQVKRDRATANRECLVGNLLQYHPDDPGWLVHCNCKPQASWLYTHVALPLRFEDVLKNMSRARESRKSYQVPHAWLRIGSRAEWSNTSALVVTFNAMSKRLRTNKQPTTAFSICDASVMEPIEYALLRLPHITNGTGTSSLSMRARVRDLCQHFGLRCEHESMKRRQRVLHALLSVRTAFGVTVAACLAIWAVRTISRYCIGRLKLTTEPEVMFVALHRSPSLRTLLRDPSGDSGGPPSDSGLGSYDSPHPSARPLFIQ
eukprot:CAMPEP_0119337810 /NCGR_PEP_ID=MMETSP1333-20130426/94756_1 /TAXON_ID=418940 /ORGANISM="Scyphosphaera apsteinii, Strain RCC1455" /LENGTH=911 /DNA_ID=CAMNT_0007348943 /DNA_START=93 /DNA_END=2828 /DNA_ORIENTATION=-